MNPLRRHSDRLLSETPPDSAPQDCGAGRGGVHPTHTRSALRVPRLKTSALAFAQKPAARLAPYRNEPPPGSLSLFFCAAAAWAETAHSALVPGNTAGFTAGTARQETRRATDTRTCVARPSRPRHAAAAPEGPGEGCTPTPRQRGPGEAGISNSGTGTAAARKPSAGATARRRQRARVREDRDHAGGGGSRRCHACSGAIQDDNEAVRQVPWTPARPSPGCSWFSWICWGVVSTMRL